MATIGTQPVWASKITLSVPQPMWDRLDDEDLDEISEALDDLDFSGIIQDKLVELGYNPRHFKIWESLC